jgi:DNA-binding transcriptional MerR regulator
MALTVSALADQAGLSADTVRYYERVGLLPEPARSAAGYRLYDQTAVGRLRLIKGAQRAGLRLREIGELLQSPTKASAPAATPRPCSANGWPRSAPNWTACAPWRPT